MVEETTTMETEVRDDYDIIESSANNVINDIEEDSQTTNVLSVFILIFSALGFIGTIIGSIFGGKKLIKKIKDYKKKKAEDTKESDEGDLEEVDVNEEAEETGKKKRK